MKYPIYQGFNLPNRQWPSRTLESAPLLCAVDLRDGNQALPNPMTPSQKLEYYNLLINMGFKEIEVGFPSASRDEFEFTRTLIEKNLVPDGVSIMALTQAREHLVDRTLEALEGVKSGILHFYMATSELHHQFVFGQKREELLRTAEKTVKQIVRGRSKFAAGALRLEFSPEEFTDTDMDFAVEICDLVVDLWDPQNGEKVILNLPATVERRPPNHYADMIEIFCSKLKNRHRATISLHAHNDQGCAVAATELALLAGADRVEGTLFGHGERTGNVDLVTLALNLESRNMDTGLDFSGLPHITETVQRITQIAPSVRHPYAGDLVFTAFSGSHQDAINKCLVQKEIVGKHFACEWKIPYLHVDPKSLGRSFEKFIRINSQSGKGGISFVMQSEYGLKMPKELLLDFAPRVQTLADTKERELRPDELWDLFEEHYLDHKGILELERYYPNPDDTDPNLIHAKVKIKIKGQSLTLEGSGNGPVSAFASVIRPQLDFDFSIEDFAQLSQGRGADAKALAYVALEGAGKRVYGAGMATNIDQAAVLALVSALNMIVG